MRPGAPPVRGADRDGRHGPHPRLGAAPVSGRNGARGDDASSARFLLYSHAAMIPLLTGRGVSVPGCLAPLEAAMDWESVEVRKYTLVVKAADVATAAADTVSIGIRPSVAAKSMVLADTRAVELAKAAARREAIVLLNEREAAAEGYRATFKKDANTEDWPIETELRERDVW